MFWLLLACDPQPAARLSTTTTPSSDELVSTEVPSPELSRPDGRTPVSASQVPLSALPGLGLEALDADAANKALFLMNTSAGACEPCMAKGTSLAECASTLPAGCENTPDLVKRLARLAPDVHVDELRGLIDYAEPWVPLPDWLRSEAVVTVVFAVDYQSPFCLRTQKAIDLLVERYGDQIGVRLLQAPDTATHPRSEAAALAMLQAAGQPGAAALHRSLLEHFASLDDDTIVRLAGEAGVTLSGDMGPELARHRQLAAASGVRGTPTVFLNGYRFRGMRGDGAYRPHVDALIGDAVAP